MYVCVYIYIYIYICAGISRIRFIHSSNQIPCSSILFVSGLLFSCLAILRIEGCEDLRPSEGGTNGVGTKCGHCRFHVFRQRNFWGTPVNLLLSPPKVPGRTFFPNLSKFIAFAAAPLVLTPFVRNQGLPGRRGFLPPGSRSDPRAKHLRRKRVANKGTLTLTTTP